MQIIERLIRFVTSNVGIDFYNAIVGNRKLMLNKLGPPR